jgi:adenylate kinase family enzyme
MKTNTKITILRGNSGSGKTTISKILQRNFGHNTFLISQDMIRREILYVKDGLNTQNVALLINLIEYGYKHCDTIILEGILNSIWYKKLFDKIYNIFSNVYAYYFDLPFEETLKRHKLKPNCKEFGEAEMQSWWNEKDFLGQIKEKTLTKDMSINQIIDLVNCDLINDKN